MPLSWGKAFLGLVISLTIAFLLFGLDFGFPTNIIGDTLPVSVSALFRSTCNQSLEDPDDCFDTPARNEALDNSYYDKGKNLHYGNDKEAKRLWHKVPVLVWVMTGPKNLETRAKAARDTWGKRCNKILFFSSETNDTFPAIGLDVQEGRKHLTAKTMQAFRYVYEHHFNDAEWFMKADDDTYLIVENLRYFLSSKNTSQPIFFGHFLKGIVRQGFYSGGGGYVLSKEALRRFGEKGAKNICRQDGGDEDVEMGRCMEKLGVKTGSSNDALGRSRFHCFNPSKHLLGNYYAWYKRLDANGAKKGQNSISEYAISFHYITPEEMWKLELFLYHIRPYGIAFRNQDLNTKLNPNS